MTELTRLTILGDPKVYATAFGPTPEGMFGIYIGTIDETPSGCERPRVLLTSSGVYETAEAAMEAGQRIIREIRAGKNDDNFAL